jgi:hypothetical protein
MQRLYRNTVKCRGYAWRIRRVLDRMIGFIGASLQLHLQLQLLIAAHSRWLSQARSISFLDYERLFHGGWLLNFITAFFVGSVVTHCGRYRKVFPPFFFLLFLSDFGINVSYCFLHYNLNALFQIILASHFLASVMPCYDICVCSHTGLIFVLPSELQRQAVA